MAYYPKKIKDNEIQALHYLLEEILYDFFDEIFENLEGADYIRFINEADDAECNVKPISVESVKKIFKLYKEDTGYRPNYTSINFLVYGLCKKNISFKGFHEQHKEEIDFYAKRLKYEVFEYNFKPNNENQRTQSIQKYNLGDTSLQIDLSNVFVSKIIQSIEPILGDLISERIDDIENVPAHNNSRISKRLQLKESLRQQNIDNIIARAISFGYENEPSHEEVDKDWLLHFFNISQDISNDNIQYIWAKILANEIDEPGSFSRRTLDVIKLINSDEAKIFTLLCNCLWEIHPEETLFDRVLFINSNLKGKYSDATWGFDAELLQHLQDIRLVHSNTFIILEKDEVMNVSYSNRHYKLSTKLTALEVEVVRLSSVGSEIFDVVKKEVNEEYYNHTLEFFKQSEILIK